MVLPENTKLRFDLSQGKIGLSPAAAPAGEPTPMEDTEAQMRRALGLYGDGSRQRIDPERSDGPQRSMDRFAPGGHRRRFVQDGDVPVTIVRRDAPDNRPAALVPPSQSRLQRTEAALAVETAARDRAERALADAQTIIRDLQTKIGHADLAKNEAVDALRQEREAHAAVVLAAEDHERLLVEANDRVQEAEDALDSVRDALGEERGARKGAERALRDAVAAREHAERLLRDISAEITATPAPMKRRAPPEVEVAAPAPRRGVKVVAPEPVAEPEPVKWWLMTKPVAKRRP
jgi:hypothetical protein